MNRTLAASLLGLWGAGNAFAFTAPLDPSSANAPSYEGLARCAGLATFLAEAQPERARTFKEDAVLFARWADAAEKPDAADLLSDIATYSAAYAAISAEVDAVAGNPGIIKQDGLTCMHLGLGVFLEMAEEQD